MHHGGDYPGLGMISASSTFPWGRLSPPEKGDSCGLSVNTQRFAPDGLRRGLTCMPMFFCKPLGFVKNRVLWYQNYRSRLASTPRLLMRTFSRRHWLGHKDAFSYVASLSGRCFWCFPASHYGKDITAPSVISGG